MLLNDADVKESILLHFVKVSIWNTYPAAAWFVTVEDISREFRQV